MQTANLETTACVEPLKTAEQIINRIPSDADFVSLIEHLNSVIQQLSSVTEMEATLFIQAKVTVRFGLTKTQTNCIVKSIRDLRKKNHLTEARVPVAKKPVEFSSNLPYLVDVVNLDGKSAFLFKSPDGRVSIEDRIELEDRPILPPPIENLPYLLPRAECVMAEFERYSSGSVKELDEKLYDDLLVYLQESADLPNLESYHLLTTWVIHTYLMEYFHHSPILMLHGAPARGKSRLGRALINASFRGVHLVSLAAPHLIRLATDHSASLFFDVKDLGKRLRQEQTLDLFLLRGERGAITPRVTHPSKGAFLDMRFYTLFGPTIIAANEIFDDSAFESRTLCLRMPFSKKNFGPPVTPEVALPLKERLLAFRCWHIDNDLPSYGRYFPGRLGDITDPLFQIIEMVKPEALDHVVWAIRELEADALACREESPDIRILRAVCHLAESSKTNVISVTEIWEYVNAQAGLRRLSRETIGWRLNAFGFDRSRRTSSGRRAISYDRASLDILLSRNGISFLPKVFSLRPEDELPGIKRLPTDR